MTHFVAQALMRQGVTHIHVVSGNPVDATLAACARLNPRAMHPSELDAELHPALLHDGPACLDVLTHDLTPLLPVF